MVRGWRLTLQLAGRGFLSSAAVRPCDRSGFVLNVLKQESTGKVICGEAEHLISRNFRIATRAEASLEKQETPFNSIPKLLSKYGDNKVDGSTVARSEDRSWFEFQRRGISSLGQAAKTSADPQKEALISRSDDNVGGQGQTLPSQPPDKNLKLTSEEEENIAHVLARPDLLITRNVEWANVWFGFEQQNKYVVMDPHQPQAPVGYIVEESNVLLRQILRTKRPFVVSVLDATGEEVCRVRRPAFLINSSIFVEVNGKVIGECHQRWHLWKRIYDVYIGNKQFATVENPGFWNWNFTLTDDSGGILAEIERNWRGFGFEFLTDAGQYVVRFGDVLPKGSIHSATLESKAAEDRKPILLSKTETTGAAEMQRLLEASEEVDALAVARPLSVTERAVALALAVSLDNDYFSRHSQHGETMALLDYQEPPPARDGMPLPIPFYTSSSSATAEGSSNAEHETGHEVFPSQGYQGSQSGNSAGDSELSSDTKDDKLPEDDPFFGMFDEADSSNQSNDNQVFDDTPDSGDSWGLDDWFGAGNGDN